MLDPQYLREVPLPPNLTNEQIFLALQDTQEFFQLIREKAGISLPAVIQANNFSGVVSNVFTKMLSDRSPYKQFHDQKYPDLKDPNTGVGLEIKGTNKALKGGEGHNGHTGWHMVVCYDLLDTGDIEFIHVEIAELIGYEQEDSDWHYNGSKRNENNSQRTETYTTNERGTAKLRDGSVYLNTELVKISKVLANRRLKFEYPVPNFSPFYRL